MKRRSFLLCLSINVLLWGAATVYFLYCRAELSPAAMVKTIQQDVYRQQKELKALLANRPLLEHIWQNRLSDAEFNELAGKRFTIRLFDKGRLSLWNRDDFAVSEFRFFPEMRMVAEAGNVFLYQSFGKAEYPDKRLNVIIPVFKHYETENEFLHSMFYASKDIPESSGISPEAQTGYAPILSSDGTPLFYVHIHADNIRPMKPNSMLQFMILAALLFSVLSLHLVGIYLSRIRSVWTGIGFILACLLTGSLLVYFFGLPFDLENLELFSPRIFASNGLLASFGHLLLHILAIYWLLSFSVVEVSKMERLRIPVGSRPVRYLLFVVTITIVFSFGFYLQHLVQSIVFDSDISFDTNTFNATDKFTLLALITIAVIARTFMRVLQLCNIFTDKLIPVRRLKYLAILLISFSLLFLYRTAFPLDNPWHVSDAIQIGLDMVALLWALAYVYLIDSNYFRTLISHSGLFTLIFLSIYFSILFSVYFKFYIDEKEKNITRIAFAEKLSRQQDTELELKFDEIESRIRRDTILQSWMEYSDSVNVRDIYNHFKLFNADIYFSKYTQDIYLFNSKGRSIIPRESVVLDSFSKLRDKSIPTLNPALFFRIDSSEQGAYLVFQPIKRYTDQVLLGYLCINFKLKQNITQSVYPRLLKDQVDYDSKADLKYNYAIYLNGKLANQSGSYHFDYKVDMDRLQATNRYVQKGEYSELLYKVAPNMVYTVVYRNNIAVGILTIFSFLFGISLIIATLENRIGILCSSWIPGGKVRFIYNTGMSARVKYFALGFTAISFFIIGLSTVVFLTNRYQANSIEDIEANSANIAETVEEYLQNQKSIVSGRSLSDQMINNDFAFLLANIARQQKIDINIFDVYGKLAFTTQDNVYKANVLDDNMSARAFFVLKNKRTMSFIQPEHIGQLHYTASYSPIINHENKLVGYLNIPSFYTKEHLDTQIISLITTLVNIYTILLLLSSVITFLFINTLTKSLRLVADSMKNVSLKNNELINWPYEDEIGLLVKEYNKMVATVEKNARSLVLDERQNAWREMAQQVAHEIKNPLTPMKLNIQYLQQAINSNHPDIINLTKRVSSSIIEQIDNLNYIASEFSNFAKMPENKTERIDLKSMLDRIVLLFAGNKNLTITHAMPDEPVVVFADKSQMLRIFTNIVQNAVESIPEEREGIVDIQLLFLEDDNSVLIKVKDNGSGIPDDVKDKIFDPYFTTKSSGTGLGLAMTKKIIELWGGSIRFESDNSGTTFFLTVPEG